MEISQDRRISGKLVDRLVRKIRIISYISGRIREPVAVLYPFAVVYG